MAQKSLLDYLESIPDPRNQAKCSHILSEVVFMAICAMMCGFDTWSEITLFAQEREPWFRRWLSLPGGIPSHDTFNRIFATLPPASLKSIFQAWIGDIMGDDKLRLMVKLFVLPLKGEVPTLFIWSMSGQLSWGCVLASKKSLTNLTRVCRGH